MRILLNSHIQIVMQSQALITKEEKINEIPSFPVSLHTEITTVELFFQNSLPRGNHVKFLTVLKIFHRDYKFSILLLRFIC